MAADLVLMAGCGEEDHTLPPSSGSRRGTPGHAGVTRRDTPRDTPVTRRPEEARRSGDILPLANVTLKGTQVAHTLFLRSPAQD